MPLGRAPRFVSGLSPDQAYPQNLESIRADMRQPGGDRLQ